jgi:hypothetical protein
MDKQTNHILEFVAVSKETVSFLEEQEGLTRHDFIRKARQILPLLYLKASFLPETENMLEGDLEQFVTPEHYQYMKLMIKEKLGDFDATIQLEDEFMMNTEDFLHVELSELFADIYQDIGNFLMQYREGDESIRNDAVWECHYNFQQYWGLRTLILTEHLHRIMISDEFLSKEEV